MSEASGPQESFLRLGPEGPLSPVLLSVPHAGRDYPLPLRARAVAPLAQLEALEDRYAELLIDRAVEAGVSALVATRARCWIDLNRDEREVDPAMIDPAPPLHALLSTAKVRGGLGLIPRRLHGIGEIARGRIAAAELDARIVAEHRPWHAAIASGLAARRACFGAALLIDCHSMPPIRVAGGGHPPQLVIGDRHGRSASGRLSDRIAAIAGARGLTVARNAPYSGGHTVERHGQPGSGIHAVQIELDRSLYLAGDLRTPSAGLPAMQALIAEIAFAMAEELAGPGMALAAE